MAVASPYRRARLLSFLDPSAHGSSSGYQVMQSLIGLGSGHLFGMGIGGGQAQWGYLPNAHTDFIFSVIGEQLGIVGALLVLGLLGGFIWLGIRAAMQAPDRFGALLALGLVAWVAAETLINVGAVVGVLPVTGIPLPFISFGGSSLVITMVAAGDPHQHRPAGRGGGTPSLRLAGGPAVREVGEPAPGHGDRGRRDGRSHRAVAPDRPRDGGAGARGRDDRALRLAPRAGGDHLAHPRVPLHAAARAWHQAEPATRGAGGPTSGRCWACVGLSPRRWVRS